MQFAAAKLSPKSIVLSEVSQTERQTYDITYTWKLKMIETNLLTHTKEKYIPEHIENKFGYHRGKGERGIN